MINKGRTFLFNEPLNTFYLRLYGIGHITVKDHSAREETCCYDYMGYSFWFNSKGSLVYTIIHTRQHKPWPLLDQSWSTGWNEK